ncbi:hypothetical protein [Streptomyces sp. NPDC018045]|uniref:hypothetical protein n=1 Tax=Streptomyces sp. NPDC018045 TaxID=3365037 RepID=UPI0037906B48
MPGRFPSSSLHRLLVEVSETCFTDRATATGTLTSNGVTRPVSRHLVHTDFFGLTTTVFGRIVLEE